MLRDRDKIDRTDPQSEEIDSKAMCPHKYGFNTKSTLLRSITPYCIIVFLSIHISPFPMNQLNDKLLQGGVRVRVSACSAVSNWIPLE